MIQVIVYSTATGRVRRVEDPEEAVPNAIAYLAQVPIATGEARLLYTKQGNGLDTSTAWQNAVNTVTGKSLIWTTLVGAPDWYCGVNGSNLIQWWGLADPALDSVPGLTLVNAPAGADNTWTYNGTTFTAPVVVKP